MLIKFPTWERFHIVSYPRYLFISLSAPTSPCFTAIAKKQSCCIKTNSHHRKPFYALGLQSYYSSIVSSGPVGRNTAIRRQLPSVMAHTCCSLRHTAAYRLLCQKKWTQQGYEQMVSRKLQCKRANDIPCSHTKFRNRPKDTISPSLQVHKHYLHDRTLQCAAAGVTTQEPILTQPDAPHRAPPPRVE